MSARDTVEIGLNRFARRGYDLDEVSIVPSRRTRDVDDVSTAWQIDAFRFDIPLVTSPSDAVVSPTTAIAVGKAGGLGVLNAEGLWTRYEDPEPVYRKLRDGAGAGAPAGGGEAEAAGGVEVVEAHELAEIAIETTVTAIERNEFVIGWSEPAASTLSRGSRGRRRRHDDTQGNGEVTARSVVDTE